MSDDHDDLIDAAAWSWYTSKHPTGPPLFHFYHQLTWQGDPYQQFWALSADDLRAQRQSQRQDEACAALVEHLKEPPSSECVRIVVADRLESVQHMILGAFMDVSPGYRGRPSFFEECLQHNLRIITDEERTWQSIQPLMDEDLVVVLTEPYRWEEIKALLLQAGWEP